MKEVNWYEKMHRELWRWLADTGDLSKENWPGWDDYGIDPNNIRNQCFACKKVIDDMGEERYRSAINCRLCLFNWGDRYGYTATCQETLYFGKHVCEREEVEVMDSVGLYDLWNESKDTFRRKKYAKQIAELPLKGEICHYHVTAITSMSPNQEGK